MKSKVKLNQIIVCMLIVMLSMLLLISTIVYFQGRGKSWTIKNTDINTFAEINELSEIIADELSVEKEKIEIVDMHINVGGDNSILKLVIDIAVKTNAKFKHYQIQKNDVGEKFAMCYRGESEEIASYISLVEALNLFSKIPIESNYEKYSLVFDTTIHASIQPINNFNSFVFDGLQYIVLDNEKAGIFVHISKIPYENGEWNSKLTALHYYQIINNK